MRSKERSRTKKEIVIDRRRERNTERKERAGERREAQEDSKAIAINKTEEERVSLFF